MGRLWVGYDHGMIRVCDTGWGHDEEDGEGEEAEDGEEGERAAPSLEAGFGVATELPSTRCCPLAGAAASLASSAGRSSSPTTLPRDRVHSDGSRGFVGLTFNCLNELRFGVNRRSELDVSKRIRHFVSLIKFVKVSLDSNRR